MNKIWKKYEHALDYIESKYGGRKIELDYETPFQLLCAVILSAQTTDKQVNRVTPPLFARIKNPSDMYNISLEEIENYLQYINFFRNKSRYIWETGKILAEKYNEQIPNDLKTLQTLPGVGVKTAKVVMNVLYDASLVAGGPRIPSAFFTHVPATPPTPPQTDRELEKILPEKIKKKIHHPMVLFGRYHCTAKKPKCENCKIRLECNY